LFSPELSNINGANYIERGRNTIQFSADNEADCIYNDNDSSNQGVVTLSINIFSRKGSIQRGTWKLEVILNEFSNDEMEDSEKFIHAWLDCKPVNNEQRRIEFRNVSDEDKKTTLTIPGTARYIITVGNVDSNNYSDILSSLGPTRDDRNQPIVAANGNNVTVALSGDYSRRQHSTLFVLPGGTSYSAPRVAGAIALCLSAREKRTEDRNIPRITADDIQQWIINAYDSTWQEDIGYGILVDGEKLLIEEANSLNTSET
jgi:subtilisin family serine protease